MAVAAEIGYLSDEQIQRKVVFSEELGQMKTRSVVVSDIGIRRGFSGILVPKWLKRDWLRKGLLPATLWKYDLAVYTVWKPTCSVVQDQPLALLDPNSMSETDWQTAAFQNIDHRYKPPRELRATQMGVTGFSEKHRWYYYKDMRENEAIIFKQTDERKCLPGPAPHNSFSVPLSAAVPPRTSINVNILCCFERPKL
eukprot:Hpha_TRINITY_DN15601_c2_g2::TRINITY_DN15601_c2_g2_i1::g.101084::m.101084